MALTQDEKVRVVEIYLREFLNCSAVKAEAVDRSGGDSSMYRMCMKLCVNVLAVLGDFDNSKRVRLIEDANTRAKRLFVNGEDWRRELRLWDALYRMMQA